MIFIIATGEHTSVYPFAPPTQKEKNEEVERLDLSSINFPDCSVFIETYTLFDCRAHQSKEVRVFGYTIAKASEEGKTIIILVPDASMVDRRIRNQAVILTLKHLKKDNLVDVS